jgi:type II secretory pathway pseudopilin PulG
LIEVMVAASVMVVGLMGFLQVLVLGLGSSSANREADLATDAARQLVETMQSETFTDLFRRYNADPSDDPGGVATAPGANFTVPGLDPIQGDPDGFVGQVILPSMWVVGVESVREDVQSPSLGMPRDLNGDGVVDNASHSADYGILPVMVRLQWRGATGTSRMEFKTVMTSL